MGKSKRAFSLVSKAYRGFTFIEVLVVVAILSLLILVGLWANKLQVLKGRDARRKSDINRIKIAIEEYQNDHDCYPSADLLECDPGEGLQPYINKIPCQPGTNASYLFYPGPEDSAICPKWFWLFSFLSNLSDPTIEKLGCKFGCGPDQFQAVYQYYTSSPNAPNPFSNSSPEVSPDFTGRWGCFNGWCQALTFYCVPNYATEDSCKCRKENNEPQNPCEVPLLPL